MTNYDAVLCGCRFEDNILCMLSNAVKFSQEIPDVDVELRAFVSKSRLASKPSKFLTVEVYQQC